MLAIIIAAVIPIVFIAFVIYLLDTEREPIALLIRCFLWGMIIVIPVVLVESLLQMFGNNFGLNSFAQSIYDAFLIAGSTEEVFKFVAVWHILRKTKYFDQFYDGIVFAVFVSLGFALVENILYVAEHGMTIALIRGFLSVPAHAFFAIFMGYHLSLWRIGKPHHRAANLILAIVIPITVHGLFDFFLMDVSKRVESHPFIVIVYMLAFFSLNIWFWRAAYKRIKFYLKKDLQNLNLHKKEKNNS
ncbi:MAG: PrsW family glutamic-type intramembrane protease [Bacteroidia bacterium]|nr:PrsW family glutamic-type intramembrane protease [Bacteroidia bacterium]